MILDIGTIGTGVKPDLGLKDAVHVPVMLCICGEGLRRGQPVEIIDAECGVVRGLPFDESRYDGVVDPFIVGPVAPGRCFWVFLRPGTTSAVRHDFTLQNLVRGESVADVKDSDRDSDGGCGDEEYDPCGKCYT